MAKRSRITLTKDAGSQAIRSAFQRTTSWGAAMRNLALMKHTWIKVCFVAASVLPHYALAQDSVPVETTLKAEVLEKIELSNGRQSQRLTPAAVITQGDVVYYTVHVRNPTTVPARDVQVIQRIPENTRYVPDSASGPSVDITFSVDGGQTFNGPKDLVVLTSTGAVRSATASDYTHIRWQLRNVLAPSAVALVRFQATFE
jgi:uncharacterized repeat protein (TIGR01451 family)